MSHKQVVNPAEIISHAVCFECAFNRLPIFAEAKENNEQSRYLCRCQFTSDISGTAIKLSKRNDSIVQETLFIYF